MSWQSAACAPVASVGTTIAVVGPGAIGSTVAALLHAAGQAVMLVLASTHFDEADYIRDRAELQI